jgi:poly-gamma-glutamate synthesis protein (capsule biosynthesis protein)
MRGDPRFAADLKRCGFTILNVANNHANQHGDAAFHDTCRHVREAGMLVCGLPGSNGWLTDPVMIETTDKERVGVLAYCLHPRQYFPDRAPPFTEGNHEGIVADVRRLCREADAVVVSVHWGLEFTTDPSVEQVGLATAITDAGGCLLLGHHSHVVGPFTRAGSSVVAYGLGNFVSDMLWDDVLRRGAILIANLDGDAIRSAEVVDTKLDARGAPRLAGRRPVQELPIPGISHEAHRMQASRETARLRKAKARYLAANVRRMKPGYALQWIVKVIRNRLSFLL